MSSLTTALLVDGIIYSSEVLSKELHGPLPIEHT